MIFFSILFYLQNEVKYMFIKNFIYYCNFLNQRHDNCDFMFINILTNIVILKYQIFLEYFKVYA